MERQEITAKLLSLGHGEAYAKEMADEYFAQRAAGMTMPLEVLFAPPPSSDPPSVAAE